MKRYFFILPMLFALFAPFLVSCSEENAVDEYANWEQRNTAYVDSIAQVAKANADGKWLVYLNYKLQPDTGWTNENYVYCHVEQEGSGTGSPLYTDTVRVNYRGWLIPTTSYPNGYVFDQSYRGELNPDINVPSKLALKGCITGWITALQQMSDGDIWTVYIPSALGYGDYTQSNIPAYSTLIYKINLVAFYPVGTVVPEWQ